MARMLGSIFSLSVECRNFIKGAFMDGGTTKTSGWAVFWFLTGFTILGTAAIGGGVLSLIGTIVTLGLSAVLFKAAREKEGT